MCAGKIIGRAPRVTEAAELQRALTKVVVTCLSLKPAAKHTALHVLKVLEQAEQTAGTSSAEGAKPARPFIAFANTYPMYMDLVQNRPTFVGVPPPAPEVAREDGACLATLCQRLHWIRPDPLVA
jgi:hypothetical protein